MIWLIGAQVDLRLKIVARIKCLFGKHAYKDKGKPKYRCQICSKAQFHLKAIDGGKKSIDLRFRF